MKLFNFFVTTISQFLMHLCPNSHSILLVTKVEKNPINNQGQASGMDGTLTLIFAISKTIRDSKKFIKKH